MTQLQASSVVVGAENDIQKKQWPLLYGRLHTAVRLIWIAWAFLVLTIFIASIPAYLDANAVHSPNLIPGDESSIVARIFIVAGSVASITAALVSLSLATLLFMRKSNDGMAMFVSFLLLTYGVVMAGPLERLTLIWDPIENIALYAQSILMATPILLLACLFPSGHFVPRWTRWLVPASFAWILVVFALPPLEDFSSLPTYTSVGVVVMALTLPALGFYAQVYRYKKVSTSEERQQTKWVVYGLGLWFIWIIVSSIPYMIILNQPEGTPITLTFRLSALLWWVAMNIVPISLTISVMKYRLWDIDLVVNRTLVYGVLTTVVVALYVLIVGGLGAILQTQGSLLIALFATGLIAVIFQPVRAKVQQSVNRLVYGDRDDPVTALSRLGKRLEGTLAADEVLPTLVKSIAETLKLPYSAIGLVGSSGYHIAAEYGKPTEGVVEFPLIYHTEKIGLLLVALRSPTETFNPADMRLLRNIARQAGAAVHSVQLTSDLRRSQQQLVTTREEERRRLRRDIHDGLGPSLAAYMLTIGSARVALRDNPDRADRMLEDLEGDLESTLVEIRRLVYNLRPPELDQLGLVGAITRYVSQYSNGAGPDNEGLAEHLSIHVRASDSIPPLSAAVEAAAYRITQEAVNNVVRHAQARNCRVDLDFKDGLLLTIQDDGVGLPETVDAGVGLASMQERAFELGGTYKMTSRSGRGTQVEVVLPTADGSAFSTVSKNKSS